MVSWCVPVKELARQVQRTVFKVVNYLTLPTWILYRIWDE